MNLFNKNIVCVIVVIVTLHSLSLKGQDVLMHTGTVSQCGGVFYDSGGAAATYQNNESDTLTICAGILGAEVSLYFTQFNVENNFEHLAIHEGSSASGLLLVNATSTALYGQTITSQGSGCLTIVFTSDGSVTLAGWAATISCTYPCQTFDVNIISANVPYFNGDTIRVCRGQTITFNAAGTYSNNNINYNQNDTTTVFTWNFGDGTPILSDTGLTTVTHSFNNGGGYFTSVSGNDVYGCDNSNYARNMIMVSSIPDFNGTYIVEDTICSGQSINLTGLANTNPWTQPIPTVVSGTTFIPDGSGATYTTSITQVMFAPGQTFTDSTDIQSLCMNIEHSYLGDLEVWLTCPSGQAVNLIGYYNYTCTTCALPYVGYPQYPGATHLGEPCDITPATSIGVGYNYCWNNIDTLTLPGAANTSTHTFTDLEGNVVTSAFYIPAGGYATETPFSNLIGCPLNGNWTIHVTDHLGADDGYIFNWSINFNPAIIPPLWSFGNSYNPASFLWSGSGIVTQLDGVGIANPTDTGNVAYTFSAIDDFGCTNDTVVYVYVDGSCVVGVLPNENDLLKVELKPNPVNNELFVEINSEAYYTVTLKIYDMQGRCVKQITMNESEKIIDVSNLTSGLYNVKVLGENLNKNYRIIKQ